MRLDTVESAMKDARSGWSYGCRRLSGHGAIACSTERRNWTTRSRTS
jgi:hypothetical protein